jgi:hypothetical protein
MPAAGPPSYPRVKALLATWAVAFTVFAAIAAVAYALQPASAGFGQGLSHVLAPGASLYVFLNGSLLFGGGFGRSGNALVFVVGSAAVWATALLAGILLVRAVASLTGRR